MKEYEFLRAEILANFGGIRQYENILYTVVAAILAFTVNTDYYLICMIPYIVIISVFFIVMSTKSGICKIATYLDVFLEGGDYHWERRNAKYNVDHVAPKMDPLKWKTYSQYYLLSLTCSAVTILKLVTDSRYALEYKLWVTVGIVVFTGIVLIVFYRNSFDYEKAKPEMIAHWKKMKVDEENSQKSNETIKSDLDKQSFSDKDSITLKTFMEMTAMIVEISESKQEAIEKIRSLSIMRE